MDFNVINTHAKARISDVRNAANKKISMMKTDRPVNILNQEKLNRQVLLTKIYFIWKTFFTTRPCS
jgi:hypothetical protein